MTRETLACLGQMVCSTNLALKAYGAAPAKRLGSPRGVAEVMCVCYWTLCVWGPRFSLKTLDSRLSKNEKNTCVGVRAPRRRLGLWACNRARAARTAQSLLL